MNKWLDLGVYGKVSFERTFDGTSLELVTTADYDGEVYRFIPASEAVELARKILEAFDEQS